MPLRVDDVAAAALHGTPQSKALHVQEQATFSVRSSRGTQTPGVEGAAASRRPGAERWGLTESIKTQQESRERTARNPTDTRREPTGRYTTVQETPPTFTLSRDITVTHSVPTLLPLQPLLSVLAHYLYPFDTTQPPPGFDLTTSSQNHQTIC